MIGAQYTRAIFANMKNSFLNYFKRNYLEYLDPLIFSGALIISIVLQRNHVIGGQYMLLILFLIAPGYVIYRAINSDENPPLIALSFSLAYSILNIYFVGLISVFASHYFSIPKPLGKEAITNLLSIFYLVLTAFFFALKHKSLPFSKLRLPHSKDFHYLFHLLLPIGSAMGTTLLENRSTNIVLIYTYVLIFIQFVFYLFRSKKNESKHVASYLLFSALALLLTYSLRSNYISGYDISHEFQYFLQTKAQSNWFPKSIEDAYQACLSITLLPTVIFQLAPLSEESVLKVIMILLISPIPVVIYYTARRYFSENIAISGSFFFLSQTWFYAQLPTMLRQGVAYLFYALLIYVMFAETNSKLKRNIAFLTLGMGLILSHYTTTYLTLALLASTKIILTFLRVLKFNIVYSWISIKTRLPINYYLYLDSNISYITVAALFVVAFLWYGPLTNTLPNFAEKTGVGADTAEIFSYQNYSHRIKSIFTYSFQEKNNPAKIRSYISEYSSKLHKSRPYLWTKKGTNSLKANPNDQKLVSIEELSPKNYLPSGVTSFTITLFGYVRTLLNNILLPAGIFLIVFIKKRGQIPASYGLMQGILMFGILLITILPKGLGSYNIERLYTQLLMTSGVFAMWLFFSIMSKAKLSRLNYATCVIMFFIYYSFYSGIAQTLVGGAKTVTLYNSGSSYFKNYTHMSEVLGAKWLSPYLHNAYVFTDSAGGNRLIAYGNIHKSKIVTPILTPILNNENYVFLAYHNDIYNAVLVTSLGVNTYLNTPTNYLDQNKNLIYNTGNTKIYK